MGKKSKNPSKQGGGKKSTSTSECVSECASAAAYRTAQQLQAGISSLSMNDAFAAVRLATQSIAQMKEEQQRAAQQLQCAREAVAQQQSQLDENKHHNDLYADKDFWEKRYQEEETSTSATATATLTHTATATVTDLYEWYLDFTELSPLLIPDIEKARRQIELHVSTHVVVKVAAGEVLVAGCGNSSMCEDLHLAGVQGVCGMDYSRSVIDAMNKRLDTPALAAAKAGGVRYLQADGTAMPGHMKCTCSAVVDKGTLDAITSGGVAEGGSGGNSAAGTRDALAYMREMWAVLQPGGVLIIVSTMPPHLFHLVGSEVVPSLVNEAGTADQHHRIRQGSGYRINSFITKEGGNVFYYALFKPESKHTTKSVPPSPPPAAEYEKLMAEAQAALKELQEAQVEVQRRSEAAAHLTRDLRDTEDKASRISKELDSDLSANVVNNIIQEAKNESDDTPLKEGSTNIDALKDDISGLEQAYKESKEVFSSKITDSFRSSVDPSIPLSLPSFPSSSDATPVVSLTILPTTTGAMHEAEGYVEVQFPYKVPHEQISIYITRYYNNSCVSADGQWDEDDFISIQHYTGISEGDEFVHFEYTDEPKSTYCEGLKKHIPTGTCRLRLPPFGGSFRATYRRVFTSIAGKTLADVKPGEELKENDAVVTRQNKAVAESTIFPVVFQVQPLWKMTGINVKCRNLQTSRNFMELLKDASVSIPKEFDNMVYLVEDLQSINVISVTIKAKPCLVPREDWNDRNVFERVSAWIGSENDNYKGVKRNVISIEADCYGKLSYVHVVVPEYPSNYVLMLNQSCGQINTVVSKMEPQGNTIVIRIPYQLESSRTQCPQSTETSKRVQGTSKGEDEGEDCLDHGSLQCTFCSNVLTLPGAIGSAQLLPSGKFDHMMHEFLCSENPLMPLSMGDMEAPIGTVLVGNIYMSVNAKDIVGSGLTGAACVVLSCKSSPSMIDAVNSEVSSSISRMSSAGGTGGIPEPMSLIDTSTCAATCSRCGVCVGDGQIVDHEDEEILPPQKGDFSLNDLSNVRFLRHRVRWCEGAAIKPVRSAAGSLLMKPSSTEQVVSQLLTAASSLFGSSSFEVYVSEVPSMKLHVRLLSRPRDTISSDNAETQPSRGYSVFISKADLPLGRCGLDSTDSSAMPSPATRVSYCFPSHCTESKTTGNIRPIAIDFSDFEEVCTVLRNKELWSSPSFRAGESTGHLLL